MSVIHNHKRARSSSVPEMQLRSRERCIGDHEIITWACAARWKAFYKKNAARQSRSTSGGWWWGVNSKDERENKAPRKKERERKRRKGIREKRALTEKTRFATPVQVRWVRMRAFINFKLWVIIRGNVIAISYWRKMRDETIARCEENSDLERNSSKC